MKSINLQFEVDDHNELSIAVKQTLNTSESYQTIIPATLKEIWQGSIPNRERISIEVAGTAVCMMDDWACTIFGKSHEHCITALCEVQALLVKKLNKKVTLKHVVSTVPTQQTSLEKILKRERLKRRLRSSLKYSMTALVSAALGVAATVAYNEVTGGP